MTTVTQWFGLDVKPIHIGYYQTMHDELGKGYCYWNGETFSNQWQSIEEIEPYKEHPGLQEKEWRGLARKPA